MAITGIQGRGRAFIEIIVHFIERGACHAAPRRSKRGRGKRRRSRRRWGGSRTWSSPSPVLHRDDVDARGERVGQRRALVGVCVEPARLLDVADGAEPAGVLAVHPDRRAQGVDQRVALDDDGLGGGHALLLYKSNRGSPWTAISRRSKRSHFLRSGRPSAPSLDSSTNLSLALRRRSVGSLSSCRRRRHWMVSHIWLTPRRRAMAGHGSGSCHTATGCASSGWFTNMSGPAD